MLKSLENDRICCIFILFGLACVILEAKDYCKNFYSFCKNRFHKYTKLVDNSKILDKHDRVAQANSLNAKSKSLKLNQVYLEIAKRNTKLESTKAALSLRTLNGCGMCNRKLLQIKQNGESMKYAECGHVFCLTCVNQLHDQMKTFSLRSNRTCPVCNWPLMQNGIIRISNIYL